MAAALAPELAAALRPDEPASAYLRRSAPVPVRTGLWFAPALRPGQAVEFVGPSGSGKTALLVQVRLGVEGENDDETEPAASSSMGIDLDSGLTKPFLLNLFIFFQKPTRIRTLTQAAADALARGEPVLLLDADATFDVERLAAALRARFRHLGGGGSSGSGGDEGLDRLVAAALSRFGLLACHSALELLAALVTLRASIEELERASGNQKVRLMLLDNAAAFYWPLRAAAAATGGGGSSVESRQEQGQPPPPPPQLNLATMAAASAAALKRALRGSGAAALVTRHAVFPTAAPPLGEGGGKPRRNRPEFFPASWLSLASRRADLALVAAAAASAPPRVRLTWRATAAPGGGGGTEGSSSAAAAAALLFEVTDAGLVPL